MAMAANEIEQLIKERFPDATVEIQDLAGDGDHYAASVVSEAFRGKSRVRSIKWYTKPCRAAWAARCTRLR